ncbi:HD domain-containing protein [Symbioplanes lichenis]|uniref:HD domain-containing protein n=1 Tax=Symbioplanes lichenis TaxID=1629072 RepID=UPI002738D6F8|nr:ATP-binding protein [Actinoplanes lichenis]
MFTTELYNRTFPRSGGDAVERLRLSLLDCRKRAETIGGSIRADHPSYTVHDVTHADALWETADLIAGEYPLTPTEGFVLGCALLVHDLAMAKAALPGDLHDHVGAERWRDAVFANFFAQHGEQPTPEELSDPPAAVRAAAERELLRTHHGEQAAKLPVQPYREHYLIADGELRKTYGELIGLIAASHWWNPERLQAEFSEPVGASGTMPREWVVDPLKIACLLRVADANHLDNRRAPSFLRAVSPVEESSLPHWDFQERLQRPLLKGDRLVYTASQPFGPEEAEAWWLCVDALRAADHELRACDTLLADTGRPRFAARSVGYVDDLPGLAERIKVRGWYPVDARVRVGNVIDLVRKLGGTELYGDNPEAALRELISNGMDAVRARRALQGDGGELRLRVEVDIVEDEKDPGGKWLIVRDNGIGMTRAVLGGPLLDFGTSYWSTPDARHDLPGLLSSGFSPTGRYGIGFFAVFMLGDRVRVTSRRYDQGADRTHTLEFRHGLNARPVLGPSHSQAVPYGGTEIAVHVANEILDSFGGGPFSDTCRQLFPTNDVDIEVLPTAGEPRSVLAADAWITSTSEAFLEEMNMSASDRLGVAGMMSPIIDDNGVVLGRAAIDTGSYVSDRLTEIDNAAVVTVGGARTATTISGLTGVFLGRAIRAARDEGRPLVGHDVLSRWAAHQVALFDAQGKHPAQQVRLAATAHRLGAPVGSLAVALSAKGYLTPAQVREWAKDRPAIRLVPDGAFLRWGDLGGATPEIADDLLIVDEYMPVVYGAGSAHWPWEETEESSIVQLCVGLIGEAWDAGAAVRAQWEAPVRKPFVLMATDGSMRITHDWDLSFFGVERPVGLAYLLVRPG